jgi:hypothetical protein
MPRPPRSGKRFAALAAAVLAALLAAGPAAAYVVYLKDGSKIVAQEKYEVRGGKAYIVLQNGTRTMIDAAEIDVARTEEGNRTNLGSAVVLEGGEAVEARPTPAPPPPTLRDIVRRDPAPPPRPATANGAAATASLPRTASGHLDLAGLPRRPLADTDLAVRIAGFYGEHDIAPVQVTRGSSDARALVEATTSSEAAVFRTLAVTAASLVGLGAQGARLEAIELLMTTPNGERAGQFVVTPELAVELLERRVDVATFYLAHVQF